MPGCSSRTARRSPSPGMASTARAPWCAPSSPASFGGKERSSGSFSSWASSPARESRSLRSLPPTASEIVRLDLPADPEPAGDPETNAEKTESEARELEREVLAAPFRSLAALQRTLALWARAQRSDKVLQWQALSLGIYNHFAFYDDARRFCDPVAGPSASRRSSTTPWSAPTASSASVRSWSGSRSPTASSCRTAGSSTRRRGEGPARRQRAHKRVQRRRRRGEPRARGRVSPHRADRRRQQRQRQRTSRPKALRQRPAMRRAGAPPDTPTGSVLGGHVLIMGLIAGVRASAPGLCVVALLLPRRAGAHRRAHSFGAAVRNKDQLATFGPGLHSRGRGRRSTRSRSMEQNLDLSGEEGGRTAMAEDGTVLRFDSILRFVPVEAELDAVPVRLRAPLEHITGLFTCLLRNEIANFRVEPDAARQRALRPRDGGSYALIRRERKQLNARIEEFCRTQIGNRYGVAVQRRRPHRHPAARRAGRRAQRRDARADRGRGASTRAPRPTCSQQRPRGRARRRDRAGPAPAPSSARSSTLGSVPRASCTTTARSTATSQRRRAEVVSPSHDPLRPEERHERHIFCSCWRRARASC